jgi:hypothetical protein
MNGMNEGCLHELKRKGAKDAMADTKQITVAKKVTGTKQSCDTSHVVSEPHIQCSS